MNPNNKNDGSPAHLFSTKEKALYAFASELSRSETTHAKRVGVSQAKKVLQPLLGKALAAKVSGPLAIVVRDEVAFDDYVEVRAANLKQELSPRGQIALTDVLRRILPTSIAILRVSHDESFRAESVRAVGQLLGRCLCSDEKSSLYTKITTAAVARSLSIAESRGCLPARSEDIEDELQARLWGSDCIAELSGRRRRENVKARSDAQWAQIEVEYPVSAAAQQRLYSLAQGVPGVEEGDILEIILADRSLRKLASALVALPRRVSGLTGESISGASPIESQDSEFRRVVRFAVRKVSERWRRTTDIEFPLAPVADRENGHSSNAPLEFAESDHGALDPATILIEREEPQDDVELALDRLRAAERAARSDEQGSMERRVLRELRDLVRDRAETARSINEVGFPAMMARVAIAASVDEGRVREIVRRAISGGAQLD